MSSKLLQTKKAVSQRAYYLRKKAKAAEKVTETDNAILDVVTLNAKITRERDDLLKEREELLADRKVLRTNHVNAVSGLNRQIAEHERKAGNASLEIAGLKNRVKAAEDLAMVSGDATKKALADLEEACRRSKANLEQVKEEQAKIEELTKKNAELAKRNSDVVMQLSSSEGLRDDWREHAQKSEKLARTRLNWTYLWAFAYLVEAGLVFGMLAK